MFVPSQVLYQEASKMAMAHLQVRIWNICMDPMCYITRMVMAVQCALAVYNVYLPRHTLSTRRD